MPLTCIHTSCDHGGVTCWGCGRSRRRHSTRGGGPRGHEQSDGLRYMSDPTPEDNSECFNCSTQPEFSGHLQSVPIAAPVPKRAGSPVLNPKATLGHINKRPRMKQSAWPGEIVASERPVRFLELHTCIPRNAGCGILYDMCWLFTGGISLFL